MAGGGLAGLAAAHRAGRRRARRDACWRRGRRSAAPCRRCLPARGRPRRPPPDNGQHVALGCCTEYLAFLGAHRTGCAGCRRERLALPVIAEDWERRQDRAQARSRSLRYRTRLPGRAAGDRRGLTRRLGRLDPGRRLTARRSQPLASGGSGQAEAAVDGFWDVFIRPALNLRCRGGERGTRRSSRCRRRCSGERDASDVDPPRRSRSARCTARRPARRAPRDGASQPCERARASRRPRARTPSCSGTARGIAADA